MVFDPWSFGISAGMGIISSIFSGQQRDKSNRDAKKAAKAQNGYNREMWEFTNDEGERRYEYAQEGVEIARANQAKNIELRQLTDQRTRDYGMQIRQFNYDRQVEMQNEQRRVANEQIGFNQQAYLSALEQQELYMAEQNLALDFERVGVDMKANQAVTGFQLNQSMLDAKQQSTRASNSLQMQAAQLEGLKAEGVAKAKGQAGRTAAKNVQAAIAESGAKQSVIAENTAQAGRQYSLSTRENVQKLENMSQELAQQKAAIRLSQQSLSKSNQFAQKEFKKQLEQANADALNKIMLDPVLAPELPELLNYADYAAEIQDAFEWETTPEPVKNVPAQDQGNFFTDFIGSKGGQSAISMGISGLSGLTVPTPPGGNTPWGGDINTMK